MNFKNNLPYTTIPLCLYIHIPWCIRKCPYCDFNSHPLKNELPEEEYITRLILDLQQQLHFVQNRQVLGIFIGGGTPSLFSPHSYRNLFKGLQQYLTLSPTVEITLEANPGTVDSERFYGFREAGINRLSIGVQSLQNDKLLVLGRIHSSEQAIQSIQTAKQAGFDNINLDLMYGLPHQSIHDACTDLTTAIDLNPTHLSWYQLTLEPNTYFHQYPPPLPEDKPIDEMQQQGQSLLRKSGFIHYEVSAFALPNKFCQHNLNYWQFGDYLAIGAGAHGKITDLATGTVQRFSNIKHPKNYLNPNNPFMATQKKVSPKELAFEFMVNALRLQHPISIDLFRARTGLTLKDIQQPLEVSQEKKLLVVDDFTFSVTPLGKRFLNDLLELFL